MTNLFLCNTLVLNIIWSFIMISQLTLNSYLKFFFFFFFSFFQVGGLFGVSLCYSNALCHVLCDDWVYSIMEQYSGHMIRAGVSKLIRDRFGFALFRCVIGPENSYHVLKPIRFKTKTNRDLITRIFSRFRQVSFS